MALNIKNAAVERLAGRVAEIAGETKTQAIRRALEERLERIEGLNRSERGLESHVQFLERKIWPLVPQEMIGMVPSKIEKEQILGYGADGV